MKMNEQQFALIKEQLRKLTSQECFTNISWRESTLMT